MTISDMVSANQRTSRPSPRREEASLARRTLIIVGITILCFALAMFLWYSIRVVLLIFAGILVAIILRSLSAGFSKLTHLSNRWSLAIVTTLLVGIFMAIGWFAVPTLLVQMGEAGDRLPQAIEELKQRMMSTAVGSTIIRYLPDAEAAREWRDQAIGNMGAIISGAIGAIVTIVVVPFIGLYIAAEPDLYVRGVLWLVPHAQRDRLAEVLGSIGYTLKWWLIGQGIDMVVIGVLTAVGMWLIGVPLALLIGFLAALFNFVPNFGPLVSLIPAMLLGATVSPMTPVWVALVFLVLQGLEGYLLLPLIQRGAVDLPGALILTAQVLLALLAGGLGLLLATPLTAVAFVAVKMLYVEDVLKEPIETPADGDAREEVEKVLEAKEQLEEGG